MQTRPINMLRAAAAIVALAFTMALAATTTHAQTQCCGIGVANNSVNCPFRLNIISQSGTQVVAVPPGGGSWTIPNCEPFRLTVIDACNVVHFLPTIVGRCDTVSFGPGCCLEICKITDCRWEANPAHCTCP